jgi:thiosulfate/3-mercaptopyruvate sulfurtransferase
MLITPEALAQHLDDPAWVVFDTRHDLMDPAKGRRAYEAGHVPGACFLSIDHDLAGAANGRNGRHPLPDLAQLSATLARCGVTPESQVVIYDDISGGFAVRLWWMLRWLGHERVALLDGGYPAWTKEGRPVETEAPPPREGKFVPRPRLGAAVDAHFVDHYRGSPGARLIDARAPDRYDGSNETIDPVGGHVPGALNRFWKQNLQPDGRFKEPHVLRREFEALLGETESSQSLHMCGSGVTACHNLFAMELAGLPGGRLYPGSWSEWCADPARAMERGAK